MKREMFVDDDDDDDYRDVTVDMCVPAQSSEDIEASGTCIKLHGVTPP